MGFYSAKNPRPRRGGIVATVCAEEQGLLPYGLGVHPDGCRIAFTAGTPLRSEVWVLKDFLPALKASE